MSELHVNKPWYTVNKAMLNGDNSIILDEDITIIVDTESGTLLKVGQKDWVTKYYNTMLEGYSQMGMEQMCNDLKLVTFNAKYEELGFVPANYNLDIDEICTVINWFSNCISADQMNELLSMSDTEAHDKIKQLQAIGF
jgi:hypothetical protein